MTTILITGIAGDVAQGIAQIIRDRFPDWRILGCDIHDRHGATLFVDEWDNAPRADSPDYIPWITSYIKLKNVDYCLPTSEAELLLFAKHKINKIAECPLVMPNFDAIDIGSDKLLTNNFLKKIGCPAPWTILAKDSSENTPFPCIFKPRHGAGSKSVFICNTLSEAQFLEKKYPNSILQELLLPDDQEVTCAVYRSQDGKIAILQLLRNLVDGSTAWAKVINKSEIYYQCERIALRLNLRGSINIQLRITQDGPRIFEINPRFSSSTYMRHLMGFSDVVWVLNEFIGLEYNLFNPVEDVIGIRYQSYSVFSDK